MIITQTPFRMSFFGGGTDMESFFRENGGAVLSTTFDKYCYVNVRHLPRFFDYSTELSYIAQRFRDLGLDDSLVRPSYVVNVSPLQEKINKTIRNEPEVEYHKDN